MLGRHFFLSGTLLVAGCSDGPATAPKPSDREPPTLAGLVLAWDRSGVTAPAAAVFGPGDTIHLQIDATDNRRVRWLGIHFREPFESQDSVEIADSLPAVSVSVSIVPNAAFSGIVRINAFARDNADNRQETELSGDPISVFAPVSRPLRSAPLDAPVKDVAFDAARGLVYLSEPDSARIAVLSLATMTLDTAVAAPGTPGGLDLSASGDSLVVALPDTRQLGVLDLTGITPGWTTIALAVDSASGLRPQVLRISAANKALVLAVSDAGPSRVYEYDFVTGTQRLRTDAGATGAVPTPSRLVRPANRGRMLLVSDAVGQVYVSQTDTFLAPHATVGLATPPATATASGDLFLIGGSVFTGTLDHSTDYYPPGSAFRSAISQFGDTAYFGVASGFLRTRLADGVTLEKVILPEEPIRLYAAPGPGGAVLAISATQIVLADLSGASPSPRARSPLHFKVLVEAPALQVFEGARDVHARHLFPPREIEIGVVHGLRGAVGRF